jgi:hypothetical protein
MACALSGLALLVQARLHRARCFSTSSIRTTLLPLFTSLSILSTLLPSHSHSAPFFVLSYLACATLDLPRLGLRLGRTSLLLPPSLPCSLSPTLHPQSILIEPRWPPTFIKRRLKHLVDALLRDAADVSIFSVRQPLNPSSSNIPLIVWKDTFFDLPQLFSLLSLTRGLSFNESHSV